MVFAEDTSCRLDNKQILDNARSLFFLLLFSLKPGQIIVHLLTLYREPANIQQTLYPDGKNHAVPSLHRDFYSAKVPWSVPGAASGNAYSLNRRAVMLKPQCVTRQIRLDH